MPHVREWNALPLVRCRGVVLLRRWLDEQAGGGPEYPGQLAPRGAQASGAASWRCGAASTASAWLACREGAAGGFPAGNLAVNGCDSPAVSALRPVYWRFATSRGQPGPVNPLDCTRFRLPALQALVATTRGSQGRLPSRREILDRYEQHTRHCPSCRRVSPWLLDPQTHLQPCLFL